MNFEELENAWSQQPNPAPSVDPASLRRSVQAIAHRRSRVLVGQVAAFALVLLAYPALSLANFRYLHPASPLLFGASVALHVAFFVAFLAYGVRRLAGHRRNRRRTAASVRDSAAQALAVVEAEMRDARAGTWLVPLGMGLAILSGYANNMGHYTAARFGQQLAISAIIILPIAWAVARDYRVNLKPTRDRLRSLLTDAE